MTFQAGASGQSASLVQNVAVLFGPGDCVHVAALGKGYVRAVRNGGRYLVEIKGRSVVVAAGQLSPAEPAPAARAKPPAAAAPTATPGSAPPPRSIDLHGKTVQEALEALDDFLNTAMLDDVVAVRIIHGRSGGRVRAAVHARLAAMASIRHFRLDPSNPGVTIVTC